jgi:hypothetical protein
VPQLKLLTAVISETLRLYPSASDIARYTSADTEVGGFFIPRGSLMLANLYSLHRSAAGAGAWLAGVAALACSVRVVAGPLVAAAAAGCLSRAPQQAPQ